MSAPLRPDLDDAVDNTMMILPESTDHRTCDRMRHSLLAWARRVQEARDYALAKADALAIAEAERDRLREALRRYGRHPMACGVHHFMPPQTCTCGLAAALGAEEENR